MMSGCNEYRRSEWGERVGIVCRDLLGATRAGCMEFRRGQRGQKVEKKSSKSDLPYVYMYGLWSQEGDVSIVVKLVERQMTITLNERDR